MFCKAIPHAKKQTEPRSIKQVTECQSSLQRNYVDIDTYQYKQVILELKTIRLFLDSYKAITIEKLQCCLYIFSRNLDSKLPFARSSHSLDAHTHWMIALTRCSHSIYRRILESNSKETFSYKQAHMYTCTMSGM